MKRGDVLVHRPSGDVRRLERPKADGSGWWLDDRSGVSFRALESSDWVHVSIGDPS